MAPSLFIFGTGTHARKVFHCAVSAGWSVAGFVDENPAAAAPVDGVGIFPLEQIDPQGATASVFVAIGQPAVRRRLMAMLESAGWRLPSLVHTRACVAPDAVMGAGALAAAGVVVESGTSIGRGAIVDIGVIVDHDCVVGDFCHLKAGEILAPRTVLTLD